MEVEDLKLSPPPSSLEPKRVPLAIVPRQPATRLTHSHRITLLALASGLPAVVCSLLFLWLGDYTAKTQWTLTLLIVGCWLGLTMAARQRVVFPLQTLANLLAGLREGDFSIRGRGANRSDPLGELIAEVNLLSDTLHRERLGALEATALLRTVISELDVSVFSFDQELRLRLVNRAGERLLAQAAEKLLGRRADELGLAECLAHEGGRTLTLRFPGQSGETPTRWEAQHSRFREGGVAHHLLVLSDLSRALREEERQAWQRLVRVLGHELNNSLTPIKSIAASLSALLAREPLPEDWRTDTQRGLEVVGSRAEALGRFMTAYAKLARLPKPELRAVEIAPLLQRVAALETRLPVTVTVGSSVTVRADEGQLEQLLINLIRNAVEATLEAERARVQMRWRVQWERGRTLEIQIEDEGHGVGDTANLFVPFFTTKPAGSGIGLVLSRQIAEAHGGSLTLNDKPNGQGCIARLTLPLG